MEPLSTEVEEYLRYGTPPTTVEDCDFLDQVIRREKAGKVKLLDLTCGAGRHAIELASRTYDVTGIDASAPGIEYARGDAARRDAGNCRFIVMDLLQLNLDERYDYAYFLFNTLSIFIKNDELIKLFGNIRNCLVKKGCFFFHLYSMWKFISDGNFKNEEYDRKDERGDVTRYESGSEIICKTNNTYKHIRKVRFAKGGIDYPERTDTVHQRVFSINEIDLLGRLTGFMIDAVYSRMDLSSKTSNYNEYEDNTLGRELVSALRKN